MMRDIGSLVVMLLVGGLALGPPREARPEEEAITDVFLYVVESWGHEPDTLISSSIFKDDLVVVDPRGHTLRGIDRVRQAYEQLLRQGRVQGSQLTVEMEEIRFESEESAGVDGAWELSWPYLEGRIPKLRGRFSVDLRADGGTWKFQAARVTRSR